PRSGGAADRRRHRADRGPRAPDPRHPEGRTMTPTVSARGVAVQLGGKTILDGVDLDVRPGQVLGLVGPNGAGKSTLLRALARLVRTTSGTISSSQGELAALSSRQR